MSRSALMLHRMRAVLVHGAAIGASPMVAWAAAETPGAPGPAQHPAAPPHLPGFMTAPGETDVLMVGTAVFLVVTVVLVGILFLHLHTLPERMAHKSQKLQFEIVAVLGLLALVHAYPPLLGGGLVPGPHRDSGFLDAAAQHGGLAREDGRPPARKSQRRDDLEPDARLQPEDDRHVASTPPSPPAVVRPVRPN